MSLRMNNEKIKILERAEDKWKIVLIDTPKSLETKKIFRNYFNLELKDLKEWMSAGKILLKDCRFEYAKEISKYFSEHNIKLDLVQTGANYRGKFSEEEIISALDVPNYKLTDYVITKNGYFHLKDSFNLIEDDELATACLKYLIELDCEVE